MENCKKKVNYDLYNEEIHKVEQKANTAKKLERTGKTSIPQAKKKSINKTRAGDISLSHACKAQSPIPNDHKATHIQTSRQTENHATIKTKSGQ